jgi:ethanolamine utilization protein EutA
MPARILKNEEPAKVEEARFTAPDRHMGEEDRIRLTSVGVDIGSSTSHLLFSRLELERQDTRYVTVGRTVLYESAILFTPYLDETTIDRAALEQFIHRQYEAAGLRRADVDTGALILTGVALLRQNARAIADLFAEEAGRFVAVSAGDNLEATMAAHGSGAVERSARGGTILNVDVGGGTTKLALCQDGRLRELAALDVGARLVVAADDGTITRLEPAGRDIGAALGLDLALGRRIAPDQLRAMADYMADHVLQAMPLDGRAAAATPLMRTPPLAYRGSIDGLTFSGGVSEFVYGRQPARFGDLGDLLATALRERVARTGVPLLEPAAGIRATVIGASQYTIQVSGSTIFVAPLDVLPLRNVPVLAPDFRPLADPEPDPAAIQRAIHDALTRFDLADADTPVALAYRWQGLATYRRLHAFCSGVVAALQASLDRGHPIVLVCDGDIAGLVGLHLRDDMALTTPVVSIDGVELRDFDYIDIGTLLPTSGAAPVVIKSLVFPTSSAQRKE